MTEDVCLLKLLLPRYTCGANTYFLASFRPEETHGTVALPGFYDGLKSLSSPHHASGLSYYQSSISITLI